MKKIISVALCVAVFGLVGCSASNSIQDKGTTGAYREDISQVDADGAKSKCKHKKCHRHGKLGEEKVEKDTAK